MSEWIATGDAKPEIGQWVITVDFSEDGGPYNVFTYSKPEYWTYLCTHWMALPAPPNSAAGKQG